MTDQTTLTDLAELFLRDPRKHTDADLDRIIAAMREAREKFVNIGDKRAGSTRKLTEKQKEIADLASQIDIDI